MCDICVYFMYVLGAVALCAYSFKHDPVTTDVSNWF